MAPTFLLVGLPGLSAVPSWWAVPLITVYLLSALGNGAILWIIALEPTLHRPMYFFLFLLSMSDVGLSTALMPTLLGKASESPEAMVLIFTSIFQPPGTPNNISCY